MDIRSTQLGILCGGTPAPGVNAVISAITQESLNQDLEVIGYYEGFKRLRNGEVLIEKLDRNRVSQIQYTGGSILRVSKKQIENDSQADNALRVLEHHRIRYLVTIGGVKTAFSASLISQAADRAKYKLSVVHIPKTIFNDLPLPDDVATFGFQTAVSVGSGIVHNLDMDARTMLRYYIVTVIGAMTGHLALAIGKSAGASLTLIPEDFHGQKEKLQFKTICDIVEAAMIKRRSWGREYGIVVLSEGLVDLMDPKDVKERFGDSDIGHQDLGRHVTLELRRRFKAREAEEMYIWWHNVGNECRAAAPSAQEVESCRDLGFGAVRFLIKGATECILTIKGGAIAPVPFVDIIDPKSLSTKIRFVDKSKLAYLVAQACMVKLTKDDLADIGTLTKLARAANMSTGEFKTYFGPIAYDSKDFSSIFNLPRSSSRPDLMSLNGDESKEKEKSVSSSSSSSSSSKVNLTQTFSSSSVTASNGVVTARTKAAAEPASLKSTVEAEKHDSEEHFDV